MRFEEHYYLQEMILANKKLEEPYYIIAFNKWIWFMDTDDIDQKTVDDILEKIPEEVDTEYISENDPYDFLTTLGETLEDIVTGEVRDNELYLYSKTMTLDPKSSILVKKVVNQLGIDSVSYMEDMDSTETSVHRTDIKGEISDTVYHGTSSEFLIDISKVGLHPNKVESNYGDRGITHDDKIFFTSRIGEAMHHALHTAFKKGGTPIILEMKIPDKDKIIADYDVEKMTGTDEFYDFHYDSKRKSVKDKPMSLSKEFGVYGYKGNIKPNFIQSVYVSTKGESSEVYNIDEFEKYDISDALEVLFPGEYMDWDEEE